jgi:hypothetical protein
MQVFCGAGAVENQPMLVIDSGPSVTVLKGAMIPTPLGSLI